MRGCCQFGHQDPNRRHVCGKWENQHACLRYRLRLAEGWTAATENLHVADDAASAYNKRDVRRLKECEMVRVFFRKWPSTAHAWHYEIYIGRDLEEITRGTELRLQHRFVHYDGRLSTSNILGFAGKHKPITDFAVGTSSSTGKFCR